MQLFRIHADTMSPVTEKNIPLPEHGYLWLLLEHKEDFDIAGYMQHIKKNLNLRHIEDIKQPNHPSFYESMADYDVLILRSVSHNLDQTKRRLFFSTTFIIYDNLLITVYDKGNPVLLKTVDFFDDPEHPIPDDPFALAQYCADQFIYQFMDVKQNIDHKMTYWQKKLLQYKRSQQDWPGLLDFKTDVRRVKMLCEEQLDIINAWRSNLNLGLWTRHKENPQLIVNLNDLADHARRMVKLATQSQLELDSLLQLYFTVVSQRTNEVMRILAIITGIFLPANLITGIFGMNFAHIPNLDAPHGFAVAIGSMIIISRLLLAFFRWRNWL